MADERLEQGWMDGLLDGLYRSWCATRGPYCSPVQRKDNKTRIDDVIEKMKVDVEQNIKEASDVNSKNNNHYYNDQINGKKDITIKYILQDKGKDKY